MAYSSLKPSTMALIKIGKRNKRKITSTSAMGRTAYAKSLRSQRKLVGSSVVRKGLIGK